MGPDPHPDPSAGAGFFAHVPPEGASRMLNVLIVVAILSQFAAYEILLHLKSLFGSPGFISYSDELQRRAVRKIFSLFSCYAGFRPILENRLDRDLPDRFMLVANHQSLIDIPVVWRLLPESRRIRFVAKRELGVGIPLVSSTLRVQGHGLVNRRGNMVQAMKSLERFGRRCRKDGSCPVIFPEGTRSRSGELGVFHTAGFRKMMEIESLPVLVAAIDGGSWIA
ncbi:MAG: lysophospholipid acyltransferase family protein, partial [Spirochaetota bacterium]